jgi:polygalacturonase
VDKPLGRSPRAWSRREWLLTTAAGAAFLLSRGGVASAFDQSAPSGWASVDGILRRIRPPVFPARDFDVTAFGAKPDGVTDATTAFRDAIARCQSAGGGRVVVPAGTFLTGPIRLRSGVNLHVADKATIKFQRDPRAYLPVVFTRFEGVELMNYSPFVYAFEAENIALTGRGTLDGQADADHWWPWKGLTGSTSASPASSAPNQAADRARLIDLQARGVPVADRVFGDGHFLRPNFIQPYRCQNVLIEDVTIVNSPMWEIHPVLCTNVTVRGVSISSHGPNNDGCNPESSKDVLVERCTFDTGDDCIALKSGRNDDGRRVNVAVENVVIRECQMKDGHGGVVIGSEISGSARNIFAERCRMDSPRLDRALRFKTNSVRGGVIEHVYMRDVTVGQVAEAVVTADFFYEEGDTGRYPPVLRDVEVRGVTSQKSKYGFLLRGYGHSPITDVRVVDCTFNGVSDGNVFEGVRDVALTNVRINGQLHNEKISRTA